ncbi:MAG: thioredoxin [Thermoleophilia bacterium]
MADASHVLHCPACGTANRVRAVPRGTPRCRSCRASLPWVVPATTATFGDESTSSVPVVVDLWAPWCGPCRAVAPVLERLASERAGRLKVVKVNVDEEPALSARFGAQSIPLLVLIRDGREVGRQVGAVPYPQLSAWLDQAAAPAR